MAGGRAGRAPVTTLRVSSAPEWGIWKNNILLAIRRCGLYDDESVKRARWRARARVRDDSQGWAKSSFNNSPWSRFSGLRYRGPKCSARRADYGVDSFGRSSSVASGPAGDAPVAATYAEVTKEDR